MTVRKSLSQALIRVGRRLFRNTLIHRLRITNDIYRLLSRSLGRGEMEVTFRGVSLFVNADDISVAPSIIDQSYEREEIDVLLRLLQPGMTFVDVGANIGSYSILAALKVGPSGRVLAFEPEPHNLALLKKTLERNDVHNVEVIPFAVSDRETTVRLYLSRDSGTHSLVKSADEYVEVRAVTLDSYLAEPVDVIKIDVEGNEGAVLEGASKLIQQWRPSLLFEFTPVLLDLTSYSPGSVLELVGSTYDYVYMFDSRSGRPIRTDMDKILRQRYVNVLAMTSPLPSNAGHP